LEFRLQPAPVEVEKSWLKSRTFIAVRISRPGLRPERKLFRVFRVFRGYRPLSHSEEVTTKHTKYTKFSQQKLFTACGNESHVSPRPAGGTYKNVAFPNGHWGPEMKKAARQFSQGGS